MPRGPTPAAVRRSRSILWRTTRRGFYSVPPCGNGPGPIHTVLSGFTTLHGGISIRRSINSLKARPLIRPMPCFTRTTARFLLETAKTGPNETSEKSLRHLESSLSRLEKALKIDENFLPALFNRALCLQEMNLSSTAREAWEKYLEKDPSSPWAKEAEGYLKTLNDKETGAKDPPQVLKDFLRAFDSGDETRAWKIAGESKEMITGTMISEQLTRRFLCRYRRSATMQNAYFRRLSFWAGWKKKKRGIIFFRAGRILRPPFPVNGKN